jgi:hypothetical protein
VSWSNLALLFVEVNLGQKILALVSVLIQSALLKNNYEAFLSICFCGIIGFQIPRGGNTQNLLGKFIRFL